jgi:hypothetical protein
MELIIKLLVFVLQSTSILIKNHRSDTFLRVANLQQ